MKPFAFVITYSGAPTRAFGEEDAGLSELRRLNRQYRADQDRRQLVPVFTRPRPLEGKQIQQLVARARLGGAVDAVDLVRAVEAAHGIE